MGTLKRHYQTEAKVWYAVYIVMTALLILPLESPEPETFDLQANEASEAPEAREDQKEVSAADYNPDADRAADDARQLQKQGGVVHGVVGATATAETTKPYEEEGYEDEDDMFAVGTAREKPSREAKEEAKETGDTFVPVSDC
jgi:hypothetical protein